MPIADTEVLAARLGGVVVVDRSRSMTPVGHVRRTGTLGALQSAAMSRPIPSWYSIGQARPGRTRPRGDRPGIQRGLTRHAALRPPVTLEPEPSFLSSNHPIAWIERMVNTVVRLHRTLIEWLLEMREGSSASTALSLQTKIGGKLPFLHRPLCVARRATQHDGCASRITPYLRQQSPPSERLFCAGGRTV